MRAIIESVGGDQIKCSLCGYRRAPVYISAKKLLKPLAEGCAIVYYEKKWFFNKKHHAEQGLLISKLINDVFV